MRLAIVGSRNFTNYTLFQQKVNQYIEEWKNSEETNDQNNIIECVISGGARGADALAEKWARENKYPIRVYSAEWSKYGPSAGPLRNTKIVESCTHLIAFPSIEGKGTQDSIRKAMNLKKPIKICYFDQ